MNGNEKRTTMSTDEMMAYLEVWSLAGLSLVGGVDVKLLCVSQGHIVAVLGICKQARDLLVSHRSCIFSTLG